MILRVFLRMLGYALEATDRDLQNVFVERKVNAWICAQSTTDRDLEGVSM